MIDGTSLSGSVPFAPGAPPGHSATTGCEAAGSSALAIQARALPPAQTHEPGEDSKASRSWDADGSCRVSVVNGSCTGVNILRPVWVLTECSQVDFVASILPWLSEDNTFAERKATLFRGLFSIV